MWSITFMDCTLLAGAFFVYIYWYLTKTFSYWTNRNVKGDKPYPIIGTAGRTLLFKMHSALLTQEGYNSFPNEPAFGGHLMRTPLLVLRDPDLIKSVMVRDFNNFQDRGIKFDTDLSPLTKHLFLATGEEWRVLRQKLTPTFTSGKMRKMFPLIVECGEQFQKYIDSFASEGTSLEVKEATAKYTTDVIGSCAFGININSLQEDDSPFRVMGRKIFNLNPSQALRIFLVQLLPLNIVKALKIRIMDPQLQSFFINSVKAVMESRDYKPSPRNDFMDLLIELKSTGSVRTEKANEKSSDKLNMTIELLAAQAFVFFIAGFETSSNTMSYVLYELAMNPNVQETLIEDMDSVLLKHDGKVSYEALKDMTYLRMVIDETLRKYPPLGVLSRECTKSCTITGTNFELDKNVLVHIPVYALHHDEQYYPEPEKFIPERFTPEAIAMRHPFVYLPFGEGPRVCIGLRFAMLQTMVGLIAVLKKYKVVANEKTVPKISISRFALTLSSKDAIHLSLEKRKG